jgi:hypothetical protein
MIKKDYLVKQFEEFGKVLARILNFRNTKDTGPMEMEIRAAVQKYTALEIEHVEGLNTEELGTLMMSLGDQQLKMLADLLFEKMHFYLMREDDENYLLLKFKCMQMYDLLKARAVNAFDMDVYYKLQYLQTI